jgi:hypothetical protein
LVPVDPLLPLVVPLDRPPVVADRVVPPAVPVALDVPFEELPPKVPTNPVEDVEPVVEVVSPPEVEELPEVPVVPVAPRVSTPVEVVSVPGPEVFTPELLEPAVERPPVAPAPRVEDPVLPAPVETVADEPLNVKVPKVVEDDELVVGVPAPPAQASRLEAPKMAIRTLCPSMRLSRPLNGSRPEKVQSKSTGTRSSSSRTGRASFKDQRVRPVPTPKRIADVLRAPASKGSRLGRARGIMAG